MCRCVLVSTDAQQDTCTLPLGKEAASGLPSPGSHGLTPFTSQAIAGLRSAHPDHPPRLPGLDVEEVEPLARVVEQLTPLHGATPAENLRKRNIAFRNDIRRTCLRAARIVVSY
jgi:hypothetical protein